MAKATFSERWLGKLKGGAEEQLFWDQRQPGLGLRLTPRGDKFFIVQYRIRGTGTRRRQALGRLGAITLNEARDRARRLISAGLDGQDVVAERQARQKALDERLTFDRAAERWIELHVRPKRAPRTLADYLKVLRLYLLPDFGGRAVEGISRAEVLALHQRMHATPKVADYAVVVGKAIVNFGRRNDLLPKDLANPFAGVELYGYIGRERFLSTTEVGRIGDAILELQASGEISPWAAAAIRLLLFTGARKGEILQARWDWVDLDQSAIVVPKAKTERLTKKPRRIHLNAAATEVLRSLPKILGNPHIIVGQREGEHMASLAAPWARVCGRAGIAGCRIHDLRHTFASFAAADGLSLPMIGRLLGPPCRRRPRATPTSRKTPCGAPTRRWAVDWQIWSRPGRGGDEPKKAQVPPGVRQLDWRALYGETRAAQRQLEGLAQVAEHDDKLLERHAQRLFPHCQVNDHVLALVRIGFTIENELLLAAAVELTRLRLDGHDWEKRLEEIKEPTGDDGDESGPDPFKISLVQLADFASEREVAKALAGFLAGRHASFEAAAQRWRMWLRRTTCPRAGLLLDMGLKERRKALRIARVKLGVAGAIESVEVAQKVIDEVLMARHQVRAAHYRRLLVAENRRRLDQPGDDDGPVISYS